MSVVQLSDKPGEGRGTVQKSVCCGDGGGCNRWCLSVWFGEEEE